MSIKRSLTLTASIAMLALATQTSHADEPVWGKHIPAGYSILTQNDKNIIAQGDLNGDGIDDYALIINGGKRRGIMIFLSNGNDYQLALENRDCIESGVEGDHIYLKLEINKGNLYLRYDDNVSRYITLYSYTFRYKNSEFQLIGYDYKDEMEVRSINFPAKKMLDRSYSYEKGSWKETWTNFKMNEPILLKNIVNLEVDYGVRSFEKYK